MVARRESPLGSLTIFLAPQGRVRLLFQPAEEFEGGAVGMIEDGCLEGVDMVFGCHLWTYDEWCAGTTHTHTHACMR